MDNIRVLFTGAGGAGTIYMLKNLKAMGGYRTIAVDMNKYAAGLYVADAGYVVPQCTSPQYFIAIDEIVKKEKVQIIVPLIDEELLGMIDYGQRSGIEILLPEKSFVKTALDKLAMTRELEQAGIPVPKTWTAEEFREKTGENLEIPGIVKPRTGRGSRGFMKLTGIADYENYMKTNPSTNGGIIFQEFVEGKEFTISVIVQKNGHVLSVVPKEVVVKKGITKVGITRKNAQRDALCRKIQEKLKANGPFNVQLIISSKNNVPYVHEINPRFSTTVALTIESGVNEIDLLIKDRLGIKTGKAGSFKNNLAMVRYEDQIFVGENELVG